MTINPYQAPSLAAETSRVTGVQGGSGTVFAEGDVVVATTQGAVFPDRCVICNAPAEGYRLDQKLFWHPRWVYVLILSPIIYAIVALITRKTARVSIGLCPAHKKRRTMGRILGAAMAALGIVSCAAGADTTYAEVTVLASLFLILAGVVALVLMVRTVTPQRIDAHEVRMKTGRAFLDSLR